MQAIFKCSFDSKIIKCLESLYLELMREKSGKETILIISQALSRFLRFLFKNIYFSYNNRSFSWIEIDFSSRKEFFGKIYNDLYF